MAKLARNASGGRHLRWGREVHETLKAHLELDDLLTSSQRALLEREAETLSGLILGLASAVTPYREFVDRAHVGVRAKQRVANYLCDEAERQVDGNLRPHRATIDAALPGGFSRLFSGLPMSRVLRAGHERTVRLALDGAALLRALPPTVPGTAPLADRLETVAGKLQEVLDEQARAVEPRRVPLKLAVERAVFELREGLDKMDGRLRQEFGATFIASLYPELNRAGTAVVAEPDEDDDDADAATDPSATVS